MTVHVSSDYIGGLRCKSKHGPSGNELITDAPVDNHGKGEAFSPTDLVATALGACVMTTMGILAQRLNIDLTGMHAECTKDMVTTPFRRIGKLTARITIPESVTNKISSVDREKLERAAHTCPVHKSLHPDVESIIELIWHEPKST
jgi:putative redox protein